MAQLSPDALDLLTRTILGEADRNDPASYQAVAHVIKNRLESGAWGTKSRLDPVIGARKQFSLWNASGLPAFSPPAPGTNPAYDRAAQVAAGVFGGQLPDNTGGATHYYAPSGMPGGAPPDWAQGRKGRLIGSQYFYNDIPINSATTAGTVNPSVINTPAMGGAPLAPLGASNAAHAQQAVTSALANAKSMLGKNEVPDHDELMRYLHDGGQDLDPHKLAWCASFVSASLQKAGLPVPTQVVKDSAYGGGALAGSYKTYGSAVDPNGIQAGDILVANDGSHVGFAEGPVRQGPNGPEVQMIAGNEKDTSGKYTPGSYTNPTTGAVANRAQVGAVGERWVPAAQYTARRYEPAGTDAAGPASSAAPAAAASSNVPAAQAQPAAATAPAGVSPIPGSGQNPSAGFVGPGSDKYSLVQGMTTGTSHNPQLTTAANWGNLFGGGSPAPPLSTPAATAPSSQPAPDTPLPPRPRDAAPGAPLSSIMPNWGATTPNAPETLPNTGGVPGAGVTGRPPMTEGTPSMGFPAMQNPFGQPPPDQTAMLPGSMLSSAQQLIKSLFG